MLFILCEGFRKSSCPVSCSCTKSRTFCNSGYWNEIPPVPVNTSTIEVSHGNFGTLKRPKVNICDLYKPLNFLHLSENGIIAIMPDAFSCMPEMLQLQITQNLLKEILPGTFSVMPKIIELDLSKNNLLPQSFFKEISTLQHIKVLRLSENKMKLDYYCINNNEDSP